MEIIVVGASVTLQIATISFYKAVHPDGTTRLQLKGFSLSLVFEDFFRKYFWRVQCYLNPDKNSEYFTLRRDVP
jgi:hypothetical protein